MAIKVDNTNYNGEVLERILTVAATSNELVEKGLIMVIPGVNNMILPYFRPMECVFQARKSRQCEPDSSLG